MSLQLRLNLIITSLLLVVMLIGAWAMMKNARDDVRAEVASTATLALHLIDAEILHYTSDFSWLHTPDNGSSSIFRLKSLENIRHLKIEFYDLHGRLRDSNKQNENDQLVDLPPQWFFHAMDITSNSMPRIKRKVYVSGRFVGELVVTPDPRYEISEIWHDTLGMLGMVGMFFVFVNLLVYWAVGKALNPISHILGALTSIEEGKLDVRLPDLELPELSDIAKKFNLMADTLEKTMHNNRQLTQQMIQLQEVERKALARDIHDEIGQYLTAINVDATVIMGAKSLTLVQESAKAISDVAKKMMDIVRDILQRLRPDALDELGLGAALWELVDAWRQRSREVSTSVSIAKNLDKVDEVTAIAVYRIVQESLTNVSKHSNAKRLRLEVKSENNVIHIHVEDDGRGFSVNVKTQGYGLAGMRERVLGLGGEVAIKSELTHGTSIMVKIPFQNKEVLA